MKNESGNEGFEMAVLLAVGDDFRDFAVLSLNPSLGCQQNTPKHDTDPRCDFTNSQGSGVPRFFFVVPYSSIQVS